MGGWEYIFTTIRTRVVDGSLNMMRKTQEELTYIRGQVEAKTKKNSNSNQLMHDAEEAGRIDLYTGSKTKKNQIQTMVLYIYAVSRYNPKP